MSKIFTITKAAAKKIAAATKKKVSNWPIDRDLWSGGNYFNDNEDKVAGRMYWEKGRYGMGYKTYGDMSKVKEVLPKMAERIDNWLVQPAEPHVRPQTKFDRISEALQATARAEQNPPPKNGVALFGFDEVREIWNKHLSDDEYRIWANYQKGRVFNSLIVSQSTNGWSRFMAPISEAEYIKFIKKDLVAYNGNDWVPASLFYTGSVYLNITEVKRKEEQIIEKVGEENYLYILNKLKRSVPHPLRLADPKNERLVIKAIDPFLYDFSITGLSTGRVFDEEKKVVMAFFEWMKELPRLAFKNRSNYSDIRYHLYGGDPFDYNNTTADERAERMRNAQMDMNEMFSTFLAELLLKEDQERIETVWNQKFNGWTEIDFERIPVGFEINKYFNAGPINPRKALWDGVRFLNAAGSGLIAFDVGVGKTMTAILAIADALYTGQCKRPVVCVPQAVYYNFMKETVGEYDKNGNCTFQGVLPHYKDRINDYFNLSAPYLQKLIESPPMDYTITFITYDALPQIGMSPAFSSEMGMKLFDIINQSEDARGVQKEREKVDGFMGDLVAKTVVNIDDLGWDYIVVDEAHNMKNLFTQVRGRAGEGEKREQSNYKMEGGTPSARAMKLFMISQYIMRNNRMRNVILLTATPFTNSPLEIFSMLVFTAYQKLRERNLSNIVDFFDKFVLETTEMVVNASNQIGEETVVKEFNNRVVLQNLVFSAMLHKTGEEANVERPIKVVYPRLKDAHGTLLPANAQVDTSLQPTKDQAYWFKQISNLAIGEPSEVEKFLGGHYYEDGKLQAAVLLAVSLGRQAVISPYLLRAQTGKNSGQYIYFLDTPMPTAEQLFESSPKLQYTRDCVKTICDWHRSRNEPISGMVIYMDLATEYHKTIIDHIGAHCGLRKDELGLINGKTDKKVKEAIKDRFQNGEIKLLLGSSTIREGINLQNKSTVLFNLTLPWNPTDVQQLEGRIHRQNNQHSHVRIVTPLIENSVDVFMFQKLDEKTSRINSIWFRAGRQNVLNVDEFDPNELKLALMTDPANRAEVVLNQEKAAMRHRIAIMTEQSGDIKDAQQTIQTFNDQQMRIKDWYETAKPLLSRELDRAKTALALNDYTRQTDKERDESRVRRIEDVFQRDLDPNNQPKAQFAIVKLYAKLNERTAGGSINYTLNDQSAEIDRQIKRMEQLDRLQKNVLNQYNMTITDPMDQLIIDFAADLAKLNDELKNIESKEYKDAMIDRFKQELIDLGKLSMDVAGRVKQFTTHNYLLSCLAKVHDCTTDDSIIRLRPQTKVIDITPQPEPAPSADLELKRKRAKAFAFAQAQRIRIMNLKEAA